MSKDVLIRRANVLNEQRQMAMSEVTRLTNELQNATAHLHTIHGHFNEIAFLLGEAQKVADILIHKDEEHGQADEQATSEIAEI